eukprot:3627738-Amphidinium_carterae.1
MSPRLLAGCDDVEWHSKLSTPCTARHLGGHVGLDGLQPLILPAPRHAQLTSFLVKIPKGASQRAAAS